MLTEDTNGTVLKYQNGPGIDNKLSVKQGTTTNYFLAARLDECVDRLDRCNNCFAKL